MTSVDVVVGTALFLSCPLMYFMAWLVADRVLRRKGVSPRDRWLSFSAFSAVVAAIVLASTRLPATYQLNSDNPILVGASYVFGIGWLLTSLIASVCVVIGLGVAAIVHCRSRDPLSVDEA